MAHKKYQVIYDKTNKLTESTNICKFCLRLVYFDSQHVNINGVSIPHDRPIADYRDPTKVPHHGDHCPDLTGTPKDKLFYKKLREAQGKEDPYYDTKIDVSEKDGISVTNETRDPELTPKAFIKNKYTGEKFTLEEITENIKTLQIQVEVLAKAFNEYIRITLETTHKLFNDIHNGYINPERASSTLEEYMNKASGAEWSTKKLAEGGEHIDPQK